MKSCSAGASSTAARPARPAGWRVAAKRLVRCAFAVGRGRRTLSSAVAAAALLAEPDVDAAPEATPSPLASGSPLPEAVAHIRVARGADGGVQVGPELYRDLEVYGAYAAYAPLQAGTGGRLERGERGDGLFASRLDHTLLQGGSVYLRALLDAPVSDVGVLRARQALLSRLAGTEAPQLAERRAAMARLEPDVVWLFTHAEDDDVRVLNEMAYFTAAPLRCLNGCAPALTALNAYRIVVSPLFNLLSPIVCVVLPYLTASRVYARQGLTPPGFVEYLRGLYRGLTRPPTTAGAGAGPGARAFTRHWAAVLFTLFVYFQSLLGSVDASVTLQGVCGGLCRRVRNAHRFFVHARHVSAAAWSPEVARLFFPHLPLHAVSPLLLAGLASGGGRPWLASNFGRELVAVRGFDRAAHLDALRQAYALDALLSIDAARGAMGGCWAAFDDADGPPRLQLRGFRHPGLDPAVAVANTLCLGGAVTQAHALLTGANAGGKSTVLKAALLAVLLSQTLTIAPCAESARLTPYGFVSSHINVPDSAGHESLFEAEMARALRTLRTVDALPHPRRALVVMDEIFSSTNPVEGVAAAYSVAKALARHPNTTAVLSTHFHYLCRLARDASAGPRAFVNLQMPVRLSKPSASAAAATVISYPYRLRRGVSRQYVALELLAARGFDATVVADALAVKAALVGAAGKRGGGRKKEKKEKKEKDKKEQEEQETGEQEKEITEAPARA
jgi:hypothetical protein